MRVKRFKEGFQLIKDGQQISDIYFLISGSLSVFKSLTFNRQNFWPSSKTSRYSQQTWERNKVSKSKEVQILSIQPGIFVGLAEAVEDICFSEGRIVTGPGESIVGFIDKVTCMIHLGDRMVN